MSRQWIRFPLREGECSRQAHCDLPQGTYEREMGREGFEEYLEIKAIATAAQ